MPALRDTVIKYNLVCALDFFPVTARRPPHPHSPESQTSPSFPHKLYFQSFWNAVPRFDAQQQARPFFFFFFFLWLSEWQMCKCFPLSSVWGTLDWNEALQCRCRSVRLKEYLRHIRSLLSCVVETIMSAETLLPPPSPEHLREYVDFIYMTCHISAYEIEGCIT